MRIENLSGGCRPSVTTEALFPVACYGRDSGTVWKSYKKDKGKQGPRNKQCLCGLHELPPSDFSLLALIEEQAA
jgi:hypothetical protein